MFFGSRAKISLASGRRIWADKLHIELSLFFPVRFGGKHPNFPGKVWVDRSRTLWVENFGRLGRPWTAISWYFMWMPCRRAAVRSSSCFPEWRACAIEFCHPVRQAFYQTCAASSRALFEAARVTGNGFPDPNEDRLACELAQLPHLKLGLRTNPPKEGDPIHQSIRMGAHSSPWSGFSGSIQYDSIKFIFQKMRKRWNKS